MKEVVVLSLGGSLIIPDEINIRFLKEFRKTVRELSKKFKLVVVCGGGNIARKYISALRENGMNERLQSLSGISATRMNARFMSYFFGIDEDKGVPHTLRSVEEYLKKKDIVFCGALEYRPDQTSDSTSADIAKHFNSIFINMTNVSGLYDKDPKKNKSAKLIPVIKWKEFTRTASKIHYRPGQHFVLDQKAAKTIEKSRIRTFIIGPAPEEIKKILYGKTFKGTRIGD